MGKLSIKQVEVLEGRRKQFMKLYNRVTYNRKNTLVSSYTRDECGFILEKDLCYKSDSYIIHAIKELYENSDIPFDVTCLSPTRNERAKNMICELDYYTYKMIEEKLDTFLKENSNKYSALSTIYQLYLREHYFMAWDLSHKDYKGGDIPVIQLVRELNPELGEQLFQLVSAELDIHLFFLQLHKSGNMQEDEFYANMNAYPVAVWLYDEAYLKKLSEYSPTPQKTFENLCRLPKP